MVENGLKPLYLLLVEDSEDDACLLLRHLERAGYDVEHHRVASSEEMSSALSLQRWDLVVTDHNMPAFDSSQALSTVREHDKEVPVIIVSGSIGEEQAVKAMKAGANDYIMKENLTRLVPAIERELREAEERKQHRKAQEAIQHMAYHDSLTGLVNRSHFEVELLEALASALSQGAHHVLLYIDMDQFKIVNDTCGHIAGDNLLINLATVFQKYIRGSDVLARLGGDEFGVLLKDCPLDKAIKVGETLLQSIQDFRFVWNDKLFSVGASIGIAEITPASTDASEVLSKADMACYAAKDLGRNRVHVYTDSDKDLVRRQGEMLWVSRINEAIEQERFLLHRQCIQPLLKLNGGRHYEMLIRMIDVDGTIIAPNMFIPAAERYDLMRKIDRWVVSNSLDYLHAARHQHDKNDILFMNLSGLSLNDASLPDYIEETIRAHHIRPDNIGFEITETAAIADFGKAISFSSRMKEMGCHVALDDFGSGMSSFGYLKNIPVDYIKIDGGFVRNMVEDQMDCAIVESINQIGHVIGIKTIAEFVETDAIRKRLADIGVDYAQGFGIERPKPLH
ncbi:MAG: EAL domain-containing protein [Gammaproteobacteria bacterium]|nr:EAL domain-containing protein [Gammaproteobacteria bacterium]